MREKRERVREKREEEKREEDKREEEKREKKREKRNSTQKKRRKRFRSGSKGYRTTVSKNEEEDVEGEVLLLRTTFAASFFPPSLFQFFFSKAFLCG